MVNSQWYRMLWNEFKKVLIVKIPAQITMMLA